jgi:hypothetical protein
VLVGLADELLASFVLGFALGALGGGDLGLDIGHRSADHGAVEVRHGSVDDFRALLVHHRQQRGVAEPDRAGDRAQCRVGVFDVGEVEQRADNESGDAADDHADRSAEDPDQQADEAATGRCGRERRFDPVLHGDLPILVTDDDGGVAHEDALLGVELGKRGQALVGVAVILEGDHQDGVPVPSLGDGAGSTCLGHAVQVAGRLGESASRISGDHHALGSR